MTETAHVVLVGLMGVGKTSIGRELAVKLSWPLSDSDVEIERRYGATVRELNERIGTDGMHGLEVEHLLDALADADPSVICAAASIVDNPECRRALRRADVLTVWLHGASALLADRFSSGPHRPRLGADPIDVLRRQVRERGSRFAALNPHRIDVDGRAPEEMAAEIASLVGSRGDGQGTGGGPDGA